MPKTGEKGKKGGGGGGGGGGKGSKGPVQPAKDVFPTGDFGADPRGPAPALRYQPSAPPPPPQQPSGLDLDNALAAAQRRGARPHRRLISFSNFNSNKAA